MMTKIIQKRERQDVSVRVVSMPSWELFEKESQSYQDEVLPPEVTVRLAIEAVSPFGWHRYVGLEGDVIGITGFGASAPGGIVFERFGFTVDNIVVRAKKLIIPSS